VFYLQKIISSFVELPGLLIAILFLFTILLFIKGRKKSFAFLLIFTIAFYFISTEASVRLFVTPYEYQFSETPVPQKTNPDTTRIVVLSGGLVRGVQSQGREFDQIGQSSMMRLYKGFELYKQNNVKMILTGGNVYNEPGGSISKTMKKVILNWDVPNDDVVCEEQSKTTAENAEFTFKLLDSDVDTILLVTSALHMKRALWTFEKVREKTGTSIEIIPCPGDYRTDKLPLNFRSYLPSYGSLDVFSAAMHEWIGNLFYQLKF